MLKKIQDWYTHYKAYAQVDGIFYILMFAAILIFGILLMIFQ